MWPPSHQRSRVNTEILVRFACAAVWCVDSLYPMPTHWRFLSSGTPAVYHRGRSASWQTRCGTRVTMVVSRSADSWTRSHDVRLNRFVDVHAPHRPCTFSLSHASTSARATSWTPQDHALGVLADHYRPFETERCDWEHAQRSTAGVRPSRERRSVVMRRPSIRDANATRTTTDACSTRTPASASHPER